MNGRNDGHVVAAVGLAHLLLRRLMVALVGGALVLACSSTGSEVSGTSGTTSSGLGTTTTGSGTTTSSGTTGASTTAGTSTTGTTTGGTGAGSACGGNGQCASGLCLGSVCCASGTCPADPGCDATACDATGACVSPSVACGATCSAAMLTAGTCSQDGHCVQGAPSPCPNNLGCNPAGDACLATCAASADCIEGFYCDGAGSCAPKQATGACNSNEACTSGICGAQGTGHCCTGPTPCANSDAACGALDCDNTGACLYAPNTTPCGPTTPTCTANHWFGPGTCDGTGSCAATTADCTPLLCVPDAGGCPTSCSGNSDCVTGYFCDIGSGACCSGLASGATLDVDSVTGVNSACCSIGGNAACQTLTEAMALIGAARALNVTVNATVDGGGGDWLPDGETYPIALGWGVELSAPGVFFADTAGGHSAIFDVKADPADTLAYASVVGATGNPIGVGINAAATAVATDLTAITVEKGATLYLANASVGAADDGNFDVDAILVNGGATLWVGQNQSGANTGTVFVGNEFLSPNLYSYVGIMCASDFDTLGCTLNDAPLVGQSALVVKGESLSVSIEDFANVSLTSAPVLGGNECLTGSFTFYAGAWILGQAKVTLSNAVVSCMGLGGVVTGPSPMGLNGPTVTVDNLLAQYCFFGIWGNDGTATVTNSTMRANYEGVAQYGGTLDLSGGGNVVVCNSNAIFTGVNNGPGIGVYNSSPNDILADNVAWDTPGPDYFSVDAALEYTCNNASCVVTPGADGMDAVVDTSNIGIITLTGNTYLDAGCN